MKNSLILACTLLIAGGTAALAEGNSGGADGKALLSTKLGIVQAIQAAEGSSGGKAASADFSAAEGQGSPAFHVEVVKPDGSEQKLTIDAMTGAVAKNAPKGDDDMDGQDESEQD